jgi:DNA-binding MarR family transcriptional regulator
MTDAASLEGPPTVDRAKLEPSSRAALIMAHVERLATEAGAADCADNCSPQFVRSVLAARAARRQFFNPDLFADPAWDILLELYALRCEQHRTSVSKLCIAAAVPTTTALRWIEKLQSEGLLEREADKNDGRRVWVEITDQGFDSVKAYLKRHAGSVPL